MLTLVFMKIAADLAVYYTFAGFFACLSGASAGAMLLALAVQTVSFTLSYGLRRFGLRRFVPLVLLTLCWLAPGGGLAGRAVILPPCLYVVYLVFREIYEPEWAQQTQIFSVFWKAMLAFCIFGLLAGETAAVKNVVLPFGLVALLCSVLLMRSLRHEPEVYRQARYQAVNALLICGVGVCVLFLSSDLFLGACLEGLQLLYRWVLTPVLIVIFYIVMAVIRGIVWLVSLLHLQFVMPEKEQQMDMNALSAQEMFQLEDKGTLSAQWINYVAIAIGVAILGTILFFFFRALVRRGRAVSAERRTGEIRSGLAQKKARPGDAAAGGAVMRVRAQYKRFLKLAAARSLGPEKSDTSLDVHEKCRGAFDDQAAGELRGLYLEARYDGKAGREDVRRARELYARIKKSSEQTKR